jgi:hypothetical protein
MPKYKFCNIYRPGILTSVPEAYGLKLVEFSEDSSACNLHPSLLTKLNFVNVKNTRSHHGSEHTLCCRTPAIAMTLGCSSHLGDEGITLSMGS